MYIYKITNKQNGKSYIGQTKTSVSKRVKAHIYKRSKIGTALLEDGRENFDVSIIDSADTREELDELERFWIAFYNAIDAGYNTLIGGKPTKEELEKLLKTKSEKRLTGKKERLMKRSEQRKLYDLYMKRFSAKTLFAFPECGRLTKLQIKMMKEDLTLNEFGVTSIVEKSLEAET